ncbi:MAG: imidazoleglycerol-phosphate dehydratase [Thermoprotei archaeon ex4572_64]|nr:MAG: imidazoleglycerol-phosphate dehydratase [Thermoprotei archaeon ex4572_64]
MNIREGYVKRETRETSVEVLLKLEPGDFHVDTSIPFFNHLLETLFLYADFSGYVKAIDKCRFDDHHLVEDVAICVGLALSKALGDRIGIERFGWSLVPMDDALVMVSVDLGGRSYSNFKGSFRRSEINGLALENIPHFIKSLADNLRANIHVIILYGENDHHKVEAIFKALGVALRQAVKIGRSRVLSAKEFIDTSNFHLKF